MNEFDACATALLNAKNVYIFTGAGMGVASGLSTFRGSNGYYNNRRVESIASKGGFTVDPETTWEWYNVRLSSYLACEPNAGHYAIAELERLLPRVTLATQNVDNLHTRAGSRNVLELHGNLSIARCTGCDYTEPLTGPFDLDRIKHECGGRLRPNIVWFGEDLPEKTLAKADIAGADADCILVCGTSGLVYPAMSTVRQHSNPIPIIDINPNPQVLWATQEIALGTEVALPEILARVRARISYHGR